MFTPDDKSYIVEALVKWLGTTGHPRSAIAVPFIGTSLAENLVASEAVRQIGMHAIALCIQDGWNNQPTWMERLLNISGLLPYDPRVHVIWERSKQQPPPGPSPYDQKVLNNVTPFINRADLRSHMLRLAAAVSNMQPILIVNGNEKTGKSYSTNYIDHFSNHNNTVLACRATFNQQIGLDLTAEKLARDLVSQMARPLTSIPGPDTNMVAYAESLANWVLNEGSQLPQLNCWFVLDDFSGDHLHQSTVYFLNALIDNVTKAMYSRRCRLILIGYDRAKLTVEPGKIDEEIVQPCNKAEVEDTIAEITRRAIVLLDVKNITDFLLKDLPHDSTKMGELNSRLRSLLQVINGLNKILAYHSEINFETVLLEMLKDLPAVDLRKAELEERLKDLNDSLSNVN